MKNLKKEKHGMIQGLRSRPAEEKWSIQISAQFHFIVPQLVGASS